MWNRLCSSFGVALRYIGSHAPRENNQPMVSRDWAEQRIHECIVASSRRFCAALNLGLRAISLTKPVGGGRRNSRPPSGQPLPTNAALCLLSGSLRGAAVAARSIKNALMLKQGRQISRKRSSQSNSLADGRVCDRLEEETSHPPLFTPLILAPRFRRLQGPDGCFRTKSPRESGSSGLLLFPWVLVGIAQD